MWINLLLFYLPRRSITPGLLAHPTNGFLFAAQSLRAAETSLISVPDWTATQMRRKDQRFCFLEVLASTAGSFWVRTGDGQVVEFLIGDIEMINVDRHATHANKVEAWIDMSNSSVTSSEYEDDSDHGDSRGSSFSIGSEASTDVGS